MCPSPLSYLYGSVEQQVPSEGNEAARSPGPGLVTAPLPFTMQYHRFDLVMSIFFPSRHVAGTSHGDLGGVGIGRGGKKRPAGDSRVSLVLDERTHTTPQARQ